MTSRNSHNLLAAAACVVAVLLGWTAAGRAHPAAQGAVPPPPPPPPPAAQRGQAPPPATGTGFLAGQVVELPSGVGVGGVIVILSGRSSGPGGSPPRIVTADPQGRFFFSSLPAQTFNLQSAIQAGQTTYLSTNTVGAGRLIEIADGERIVDLKIRLLRTAILSGTVRDDVGDPVVGMDVRAFRRSLSNGRRSLNVAGVTKTDDRGTYRFAGLAPGDYVVCACSVDPVPFDGVLLATLASEPLQMMGVAARALTVGADVANLDKTLRTFAPAFHPSSTTVARASTIKLGPGEEKTGIDVEVTSVRATRISGRLMGASGPVSANEIRLTPAGESAEGAAVASMPPMLVQPDNRFDFAGVPPGQYVLNVFYTPRQVGAAAPSGAALQFIGGRGGPAPVTMASAGAPPTGEPQLWAAEPVTVGDDGVSGLAIPLRRVPIMTGRIEFAGAAPPPPAQRGAVILSTVDPVSFGNQPPPGTSVKPDGTFELLNLLPGRYFARASAWPGYPTLKSVMVSGADVLDLPFTVEAADITGVVFTYIETPMATLSGTLVGPASPAASARAPDISVLVFPADRKYWVDPVAASRRFRATPVSRSGSYTVAGLPSGEYLVVAVPDDATLDWIDPAKLDGLSRTAQHVQVADGDKKTLDVKR